jgi:hypothetical protein
MAVDRLRSAADAAANDAESSYLRFAIFGLYLAVVVGATTHEELLKGSVVTMPGLGVGLPIMGFYVLVPALFVLMHATCCYSSASSPAMSSGFARPFRRSHRMRNGNSSARCCPRPSSASSCSMTGGAARLA